MFILITLAIFVPSGLVSWAILSRINKLKTNNQMYYPSGCLLSALIPIFSLNLAVILLALTQYDGNCYGLTDNVVSCSFTEFLTTELTLGYLVFAPIVIVAILVIATIFGIAWLRFKSETAAEKETD